MSTDPTDSDFTPPELEEIAKLLPNYEIISFIAKGGMGAVYLARQKSLDREVAIKILPPHFGEDEEFRKSFETEAKSMAKLNHPNLVGIYDFGQVDGMLYIIMEMVHGNSLYFSAYGKTIDPEEAGRIVCEICRGLANAHEQDILHRDIKPANILLDLNASPKISDFGLARPVGDHESDTAFGTPGYTAPEVVHDPAAVDESTDLYSVGAILYELLTSKLPGKPYMPAANLVKCDPRFDEIIRKAMNSNPALRYRSATAMAKAIEEIINDKNKSSAANRLITAASPGIGTSHRRPTPPPVVQTSSSRPLLRNLIIIIVLLGAVYATWENYKASKTEREIENAGIIEQNKQKKLAADRENALRRANSTPKPPAIKPIPQQQPIPEIINEVAEPAPVEPEKFNELDDIHQTCADLIDGVKKSHEKRFTKNIEGYKSELHFLRRGLPAAAERKHGPMIDQMLKIAINNRIPDDFRKQGMSPQLSAILNTRLEQQKEIETDFLNKTEKTRNYYQKHLLTMKEKLKEDVFAGNKILLVDQEIDAASKPGQAFVDYILKDR